jgi:hypothetical protein
VTNSVPSPNVGPRIWANGSTRATAASTDGSSTTAANLSIIRTAGAGQ